MQGKQPDGLATAFAFEHGSLVCAMTAIRGYVENTLWRIRDT